MTNLAKDYTYDYETYSIESQEVLDFLNSSENSFTYDDIIDFFTI